jgi:hypothetical protein
MADHRMWDTLREEEEGAVHNSRSSSRVTRSLPLSPVTVLPCVVCCSLCLPSTAKPCWRAYTGDSSTCSCAAPSSVSSNRYVGLGGLVCTLDGEGLQSQMIWGRAVCGLDVKGGCTGGGGGGRGC